MASRNFFEGFKKISPYLAILFILLSVFLFYLYKKVTTGQLAPLTELVSDVDETAMISAYESGKNKNGSQNTYKTALNGQQGSYHHLDTLMKHFKVWTGMGIKYIDLRFCVDQSAGPYKNKFTILIMPVDSVLNASGERSRIPHDGTKTTWAVDLGDLHP